jgi:Choline sulfatase enzyme C terminal
VKTKKAQAEASQANANANAKYKADEAKLAANETALARTRRGLLELEGRIQGAIAPIVMIRRGRHKFIHSPADPDQLFDLVADPDERSNLAGDPAAATLVGEFRRAVAARWDIEALDRDVRLSQRRRRAVSRALGTGVQTSWDVAPAYGAAQRYIRNHRDLGDLEQLARFPPAVQRPA